MSAIWLSRPALAPARSSATTVVHSRRLAPSIPTGSLVRLRTQPFSLRCSASSGDISDRAPDAGLGRQGGGQQGPGFLSPEQPLPQLQGEDLAVVVRWLQSVGQQAEGQQHAAGRSGAAQKAGLPAGLPAEVLVEHVAWDPCPDSDAEALASGAEPLADSAAEVNKKARKLRKRGQETADAAVDLASTAASEASDLATAAAEEAAEAAAAVQEEAVSAASRLAESVASDVADIAGAVQAAAEDVQQTAADAARDASTSTDTTVSTKQPAAQPPAGSLGAPSAPAGELPSAQQPVTALLPPPDATTGNGASSSAAGGAAGGDKAAEAARLKESLVAMLASLDRGAAASEDQAERVDALVKRLEALGGPVSLSWERPAEGGKPGMALLDGRWRLLYSSGFTSGSLGGRRPGPSFGSSLVTLGQVFQDIYTDKGELDNVVDLFLRTSVASLPLPGLDAAVPTATARLRHTFKVVNGRTIEITFTDTEVKLAGGLRGWLDSVPRFTVPSLVPDWLQTANKLRSARFDVVYLDEDMRITRGDRGEVRVFAKGMI